MSMPGFVFHIYCPSCQATSPDYSMYVFPDIVRAEIVLPAWSRRFRCFSEIRCFITAEDRRALEENRANLQEFVRQLSSSAFTVGYPVWSSKDAQIHIEMQPSPECPSCSSAVEVRIGPPPAETVAEVNYLTDPFAVPIELLGLSVRARNSLKHSGIESLGALCQLSMDVLLSLRGLSVATVEEIVGKVEAAGCKLRA